MSAEVLTEGLATTVQDLGRTGYYHLGLPQSGALDAYSAQIGNKLVGNSANDALLECAYMGSNLRFDEDAVIAITGAPVKVMVNGNEVEMWSRIELEAGSELTFGMIQGGSRFYIAVRGGIDVPEVLGSRSTYLPGSLGGYEGRKLAAGDTLPIGEPANAVPETTSVPERLRPVFSAQQTVRVLLGLYEHKLTQAGKNALLEGEWTLTPVADRAGMRYSGPPVEWKDEPQPFGAGSDPSNIVDAGYAVGSIQIPGGTQPIILHRDAVSGGGYAMVATVISADMDLVARATPGTHVRFQEVTMEEALQARASYSEALQEIWALP
jgi:biotin-dependent carboxylase-like uncharacterized protein